MNEKNKKENADDFLEKSIEAGGGVARFLDLMERFGRAFMVSVGVAEKIFKPLEVLSSAVMALKSLLGRTVLDKDHPEYEKKRQKKEVLAFLSVAAVGLGVGVMFSTGVGAIALIAGGYVISAVKSLFLIRETNKKITSVRLEQEGRAHRIKALLAEPAPTSAHFHELSDLAKAYLTEHHRLEEKKEKQKDRKIEIAFTLLAAVAFVGAAVFPPLLFPLIGVGLLSVLGGGIRPLVQWVKAKVPRFFSWGKKTEHKRHEGPNENFSIIDSALGQGASFSKSAHEMFERYEARLLAEKHEALASNLASVTRERDRVSEEMRSLHEEALQKSRALNVSESGEINDVWAQIKAVEAEKENLEDEKEDRIESGQSVEALDQDISICEEKLSHLTARLSELNAEKSARVEKRTSLLKAQADLESKIVEKRTHLSSLEEKAYNASHLMRVNPGLTEIEEAQLSAIKGMGILSYAKKETPVRAKRRSSEEGEGLSG
jgi:hypothetical protein